MKCDSFPKFPEWVKSKYPNLEMTRPLLGKLRDEYEKELQQWESGE